MTALPKTSLAEAQQLLAYVKSLAICAEDIISSKELEYGGFPLPTPLITRWRHRGFQLAQFIMQLTPTRTRHDSAYKDLQAKGRIQFPNISNQVSVAHYQRVGACAELAALTWFQRADFWLIATGRGLPSGQLTPQEVEKVEYSNHVFVLCNISAGKLKKGQPLGALLKQSKAIVIDPFFNFACPVSALQTEGKPLTDYWEAHSHRVIVDAMAHGAFAKQREAVMAEAALIHSASEHFREAADKQYDILGYGARLSTLVTRYFQPELNQALAEIAPGTTWSIKFKADGTYDLSTRDKVAETAAKLTQLEIPYTLVAKVAIALRNPDPDLLSAKATSFVVHRLTGLPPAPIRLILHLAS
jgi:hypothetical protein